MKKTRKQARSNNRAVLYARFSPRRNAADCESCERQLEICTNYCTFHGLEIISQHKDDNLSGKSAANRPGLQMAIHKAVKHQAVLVVYSLSRLARNTRETLEIADRLEHAKADLCSTSEKIDTTTYMGRFFFRLLAIIAEMEREQTSERTRDIMLQHQATGRRMSYLLPYGQRLDPDDPRRMIPDPDEQQVIKRILELKATGLSQRGICRQLADEGIQPRQVRKHFKGRTVLVKGKWNHILIGSIIERER